MQIDADPVPDPAYHFDANPRILIFKWCGSGCGFLFDADADMDADPGCQNDADPGYQNDADPDPQHCSAVSCK